MRKSTLLPFIGIGLVACAEANPEIPTGVFKGGGRACAGELSITPTVFSWHTPFSTCTSVAYASATKDDGNGVIAYTLQLENRKPTCLYEIVELRRKLLDGGEVSWEAIGYQTAADQKSRNLENALACPLIH